MHGELEIKAIHVWYWRCHRHNSIAAPCWFSMPCCGSAGGHIPGCCCSSFGHGKGVGRKLAVPELEATAKYLRGDRVGSCKRLQGSEMLIVSIFGPRIAPPCRQSQRSGEKLQRTRPETSGEQPLVSGRFFRGTSSEFNSSRYNVQGSNSATGDYTARRAPQKSGNDSEWLKAYQVLKMVD